MRNNGYHGIAATHQTRDHLVVRALKIVGSLLAIVASVWAVGLLIELVWPAPTEPTCDGQIMSAYDRCGRSFSADGKSHGVSDYAERLSSDRSGHHLWTYGVALLLVLIILIASSTILHKKKPTNKESTD